MVKVKTEDEIQLVYLLIGEWYSRKSREHAGNVLTQTQVLIQYGSPVTSAFLVEGDEVQGTFYHVGAVV